MRVGIDARKIADFGIGTYIRGLLGGFAGDPAGADYVVFAPARHRSLIPNTFEHIPLDAANYSARELFTVGRAADRANVDLLHAPHYVIPFARCPIVVTIHDLIHLRDPNPFKRLYARTMLGRAVARSARVLTVSETVKRDLIERLGVEASRIVVTPNGIDERFRAAEPALTTSRYFLYAGNDKPHKNVGTLVEAFHLVRRDVADVTLVLAGAPFGRFQSQPGVVCPGFVSDSELAALMRNAVALVQPSLDEGFGLPAAEAMAAGTAVITSNAPALVEVTGDAALHADGRDASSLAGAMLRVARDESLRRVLASRGIDRARAFTWKRCAESTQRAYADALQLQRA
jgi:glycosyltransferase involved in cell wall biosynthesis